MSMHGLCGRCGGTLVDGRCGQCGWHGERCCYPPVELRPIQPPKSKIGPGVRSRIISVPDPGVVQV